MKTTIVLFFLLANLFVKGQELAQQKLSDIKVSAKNFASVEVKTNHGTFNYHLNNTGDVEVSAALQAIFNEISEMKDVSATISFLPGTYFLDAPVELKMASVKLVGHGHGGIDIHGANIESGSIFLFGKNCGPNCITFNYAGRSKSFPAGETPWLNQNLKVEIENLTFVGYNNTGVNTADGYSRFRGDEPNFRGLNWYPSKDRYNNVKTDGQRAIYLPPPPKGEGHAKCELLRVTGCYFTDLYTAIDVEGSDVSYINKNWFGQLTYGIKLHGNGQGMMVSENLFADLETALSLGKPNFSTFHNNTFAYISKCFEIDNISNSTITANSVYNWRISTGAAAYGAFCYVKQSDNLIVSNNSIGQYLDSRKRTNTVDSVSNGQSFIQFDNAKQLMFTNNIVHTIITQTVVRLQDCSNSVLADNIITFGEGGNAVAETGDCTNNFYRHLKVEDSDEFDEYKY